MFELYQSLNWVYCTTIILLLATVVIQLVGNYVISMLFAIHPLTIGLVKIATILYYNTLCFFLIWSVIKMVALLI